MLDNGELSELWSRHNEPLLSFIQRKVSSREEAEDLRQETFLRALAGLCCLVDRRGAERWLYRVARNLIIDRYRSRRPTEEYEDRIESAYGGVEPAEDPVAELAASLADTISKLHEPEREALVLTEFRGLGQAELAARLGLSLPAAKSRLRRARERLRALLLECCDFELDSLGGIIAFEARCARCDLLRASRAR